MKIYLTLIFLTFTIAAFAEDGHKTLYDFKAKTIDGEEFDFSSLKGKKVLIVNTASKCGFTPQFADLEKLYQDYKDKGFVIVGFPSNDFMNQDPGTNEEIKAFCQKNYGVSFLMMSKISVKGDDMHPIYQWLTEKSLNGKMDSKVKWNFQKYLIDDSGNLVNMFPSKEKPDSENIVNWIKG